MKKFLRLVLSYFLDVEENVVTYSKTNIFVVGGKVIEIDKSSNVEVF